MTAIVLRLLVLAAVALTAGGLGYKLGAGVVGRQLDSERARWAQQVAAAATQTAETVQRYRQAENDARAALASAQEANQHEIDALQLALDRERRSGVGLRSQFAEFAAQSVAAAEAAATEQGRAAARASADLQADVFGRLDAAAGELAAEAGRYRAAGSQCEREYAIGVEMTKAAGSGR